MTIDAEALTRRALAHGERPLRAGERWREFIRVESGALRMCIEGLDGREFNKSFFLPGDCCFPVTPAMRREPSTFSIVAIGSTIIGTAPVSRLAERVGEPDWSRITRAALEALLDGKLEREHVLLTLDAAGRYDWVARRRPELLGRVPLRHLASFLGMTDVTLSRVRRRRGATRAGPEHRARNDIG